MRHLFLLVDMESLAMMSALPITGTDWANIQKRATQRLINPAHQALSMFDSVTVHRGDGEEPQIKVKAEAMPSHQRHAVKFTLERGVLTVDRSFVAEGVLQDRLDAAMERLKLFL